MSEDKRDWAETKQRDEQRKPSKWLARLQRFVATERQKARPKDLGPKQIRPTKKFGDLKFCLTV